MAPDEYHLDLEQRVYLERVRIFFRHAAGSLSRSFLALFFVALSLFYADVPLERISIWAVIFVVVTGCLIGVELKYHRSTLTQANAGKLVNLRVGLGMAMGVMLGSGAFLLPVYGSLIPELMIFIILITGVGVTCIGYTTMPAYSMGMGATCMGLLTLSFMRVQDQMHYTLAAMAIIAAMILIRKGRDASRTAIEGIRVNEQLKDEVKKRQVAERDAEHARAEAERANAAKSNFLANMSHELRTPMNAVIGFSGALESGIAGKMTDKQSEYVRDIQNSGEHLLTLINDLLDLSKIEAGKLEIKEEEFDLPGEIDRCLPLLKDQAERGGIALMSDIPANMPRLRADRRLVNQMIVNLLSNAVKFTPEGGRVTVAARNGAAGGIAVSVIDTGYGMAPEEISTALLPFEQIDRGQAKEGTGLGLPLVKRMVELHGGGLAIESALGEGTTATITFPPERAVA